MRWRYDQRLVEAAVFQEVDRQAAEGTGSDLQARYHRLLAPAYELPERGERELAFFEAHWRLFSELGWDRILSEALARHPRISDKVPEGLVLKAASAHEENAQLFARDGAYRLVAIRLRPARFSDPERLDVFCRHELRHIDDLLDPDFGYRHDDPAEEGGAVETQLARERYRVLWSISVDGRAERAGETPLLERRQWEETFRRLFPFLPAQAAEERFASLWERSRPPHAQLLRMSRNPRAAMMAGQQLQPRQGLLCPLCRFPSHAWADPRELTGDARGRISAEFPSWHPDEGICGRCAEVYSLSPAPGRDRNAA